MRIIHARKRVFDADHAFKSKMTLLVWILSILKWKELGYTTVLYTDRITFDTIQKIGFDRLYDEINIDFLEDPNTFKDIDIRSFWALPKLLAWHREVVKLGNQAIMADMDVVPMSDISRLWTNTEVAVWSNKEFLEIKMVYPPMHQLSVPRDYKFPHWFTGKANPLNTGILHIKSPKIVDEYIQEVLRYARNNKNPMKNTVCITMCNAEQRMLGELVQAKQLSYSVMQPVNQGLFNRNGFHTHGYKSKIRNNNGLLWHVKLLLMIQELDRPMFDKLISLKTFTPEKEYIKHHGRYQPDIEEFEIYNK